MVIHLRFSSRISIWLAGLKSILLLFLFTTVACKSLYIRPDSPEKGSSFIYPAQNYIQNGFRVVVQSDKVQKLLRMEVRYTVGAGADPTGKQGLAHLVEHLMFEGPVNDEPGSESLSDALGKLTTYWNAFTTLDTTSYLTTFEPDKLNDVFALEMLRMKRGCLGISEETFVRAREVVRNEAREQAHGIGNELLKVLREFIYDTGHPYRNGVIGTDTSIAALTLEDACAFMKANYTPTNTIFVFSGPTNSTDIRKLTRTWLRSFASSTGEKLKMPAKAFLSKNSEAHRLNIRAPYLFAIWPLKARGSKEFRMQTHVANALSFFLEETAEKFPWALGSQALIIGGAEAPVLIAVLQLDPNAGLSDARALIEKSTEKLLDKKGDYISKIGQRRRFLLDYEDRDTRTSLLADHTQFRKSPIEMNRLLAELKDLKKEDVHETAESLFESRFPRYLNIKTGGTKSKSNTKSAFQFVSGSPKQERALEPSKDTLANALRELPLPARQGEKQRIRRYLLPNGLNVVFWHIEHLPLVHMKLLIPIGSAHSPKGKPGVSNLLPGADDYDVTVFSDSMTAEFADLSMARISKQFETHERIYDEDEFKLLRERMKYEENLADETFSHLLRTAVYGTGHPYTRTAISSQTIEKLTPALVEKWAKQNRTVRGGTLIIAGKFDAELMYKHALYYFSRSPSFAPRKASSPPIIVQTETKVVSREENDRSSLMMSLVFRGRKGVGSDKPARDILVAILNNRLLKLRSHQALTYGMYAHYSPERGLGLWRIGGNVDASRSAEATKLIWDILWDLKNNPNGYLREFADARVVLMNRIGLAHPSAAEAVRRMTELARYELEDDYYENYTRTLSHLRPDDIATLLKNEFVLEKAVVGLRGPKTSIDAANTTLREYSPTKPIPRTAEAAETAETAETAESTAKESDIQEIPPAVTSPERSTIGEEAPDTANTNEAAEPTNTPEPTQETDTSPN